MKVYLEPDFHAARKSLPGNIRQRIQKSIDSLANEPRPPESRLLDVEGLDVPLAIELRRLRIDAWRLVYAVCPEADWVWVLAIRKRPPYDYKDLQGIVDRLR